MKLRGISQEVLKGEMKGEELEQQSVVVGVYKLSVVVREIRGFDRQKLEIGPDPPGSVEA